MKTKIIVLGVPRSGTSLATEIIHRWGAFVGANLQPADERNQQGFWEYLPLKELNTRILASVNSNKDFPPDDNEEAQLASLASESFYRTQAKELVDSMLRQSDIWVWKDPKMLLTLPFWKIILKDVNINVIVVTTIRSPWETILSYIRMEYGRFTAETFPWASALIHWHRFIWGMRHTDDMDKKIFVEYEQLTRNPNEECMRICRFLDTHCDKDSRSNLELMIQVVNPALRRQKIDVSFENNEKATYTQKELYKFLRRKIEDPGLPFPEHLAPHQDWKKHLLDEAKRLHYDLPG